MANELLILSGTAAAVGFIHTISGPDHYLPFIALSKARKWGLGATIAFTCLCGIGHVLSSVLLGFLGITLGVAAFKLEAFESFRGAISAWLLIIFGISYLLWGIYRALRYQPHEQVHEHHDGEKHPHFHTHALGHTHIHAPESTHLTKWLLFIIFVFGPCEPLIPLIIYPAAKQNTMAVIQVSAIFGLTTILTMLAIILVSAYGLSKLPLQRFERYSHALAGAMIFLCGLAIKLFGL